jgi:hypothetical protein
MHTEHETGCKTSEGKARAREDLTCTQNMRLVARPSRESQDKRRLDMHTEHETCCKTWEGKTRTRKCFNIQDMRLFATHGRKAGTRVNLILFMRFSRVVT